MTTTARTRNPTMVALTVVAAVVGVVLLLVVLDLIFDPATRAMIVMMFCSFAGCISFSGQ